LKVFLEFGGFSSTGMSRTEKFDIMLLCVRAGKEDA